MRPDQRTGGSARMPGEGAARPKVLSVIVAPPHLTVSGGARAAEALSAALGTRCDVTIANMMSPASRGSGSPGEPTRLSVVSRLPPFVPWSRLPPGARSLFYRSDMSANIRRGRYDLVHLHNPMPSLEFARIASACRREGVPYVISTHGFNEIGNGERIYRFGPLKRAIWRLCVARPVRAAVRGAAGIFALSPADAPIVRAMGFEGPITQVPNGVHPPPEPGPRIDARLCMEAGVPAVRRPGEITCMFLANHTPNKGLPVLFEAMSRLDIPYLLIVGGERRDGVDYGAATDRSRPDQRIVVTGRLSDAACSALMRRSDIFVFPTLADTFPLVVLEAMAHGLPVIASDLGGIPYQLGRSGVLVRPGDPDAVAEAIRSMAEDPQRREFMARAARQRVGSLFTWDNAADRALAGYEAIMARRETAQPSSFLRGAPSFPR